MCSNIESLFELPDEPKAPEILPSLIRDEQVAEIRQLLDASILDSQQKRKQFIESVTFRKVAGIRELTSVEAGLVIRKLSLWANNSTPASKIEGSAWDNREEETWIDKL